MSTQCNCHALSTEVPEADLALAPTPYPVNSLSSLSLAHLPVSEPGGGIPWIHFLKPLTKEAVTDQIFFGQGRGKICGGWSVANFLWVNMRKTSTNISLQNFAAIFAAAEPGPPSRPGWQSRFRRFCPNFAVSSLGVSSTLPLCSNAAHRSMN